jgi:ribokinase
VKEVLVKLGSQGSAALFVEG